MKRLVNQLYFRYNTNFVYCFYYYTIIELSSVLAATARKGTIYATIRIMYETWIQYV